MLEEKALQKLDSAARQALLAALQTMDASQLHRNREQFSKLLKKALTVHSVSLSTLELEALLNALSEPDPDADICSTNGEPEADSGLRDNENVLRISRQEDVMAQVKGAGEWQGKASAKLLCQLLGASLSGMYAASPPGAAPGRCALSAAPQTVFRASGGRYGSRR